MATFLKDIHASGDILIHQKDIVDLAVDAIYRPYLIYQKVSAYRI